MDEWSYRGLIVLLEQLAMEWFLLQSFAWWIFFHFSFKWKVFCCGLAHNLSVSICKFPKIDQIWKIVFTIFTFLFTCAISGCLFAEHYFSKLSSFHCVLFSILLFIAYWFLLVWYFAVLCLDLLFCSVLWKYFVL